MTEEDAREEEKARVAIAEANEASRVMVEKQRVLLDEALETTRNLLTFLGELKDSYYDRNRKPDEVEAEIALARAKYDAKRAEIDLLLQRVCNGDDK